MRVRVAAFVALVVAAAGQGSNVTEELPCCTDVGQRYFCGEGGCDCDHCCGTPWNPRSSDCCDSSHCAATERHDVFVCDGQRCDATCYEPAMANMRWCEGCGCSQPFFDCLTGTGCDSVEEFSETVCFGPRKEWMEHGCDEFLSITSECKGRTLHEVKEVCGGGGCKVLVANLEGRSCQGYCAEQGLHCVGAWEDEDDTCVEREVWDCAQGIRGTSDAICQCDGDFEQRQKVPPPNKVAAELCMSFVDTYLSCLTPMADHEEYTGFVTSATLYHDRARSAIEAPCVEEPGERCTDLFNKSTISNASTAAQCLDECQTHARCTGGDFSSSICSLYFETELGEYYCEPSENGRHFECDDCLRFSCSGAKPARQEYREDDDESEEDPPEGDCRVYLYDGCFEGQREEFSKGQHELHGRGIGDKAESIKVLGSGCEAVLWEHGHHSGASWTFQEGEHSCEAFLRNHGAEPNSASFMEVRRHGEASEEERRRLEAAEGGGGNGYCVRLTAQRARELNTYPCSR